MPAIAQSDYTKAAANAPETQAQYSGFHDDET